MSRQPVYASRDDDSPMWFYCGPLLRDVGRVLMIAGVVLMSLWGVFSILESSPLMPSYSRRVELELSLTRLELARLKSSPPATTRSVQK